MPGARWLYRRGKKKSFAVIEVFIYRLDCSDKVGGGKFGGENCFVRSHPCREHQCHSAATFAPMTIFHAPPMGLTTKVTAMVNRNSPHAASMKDKVPTTTRMLAATEESSKERQSRCTRCRSSAVYRRGQRHEVGSARAYALTSTPQCRSTRAETIVSTCDDIGGKWG